jgi:hypothetical protein
MPIPGVAGLIKGIIGGAGDIIDKFVADPDKKIEAKQAVEQWAHEFQTTLVSFFETVVKEQASIIRAEIEAGGITSKWRPILMLTFGFLIVNNLFLAPYIEAFGGISIVVTTDNIPDKLWDLMTVAMGGYVVGRSVEKAVKSWKNGNS